MSSDAIFLQVSGETMRRAPASGYVTEADLQRLLAEYPELLASDQIDEDDPPRWLLVAREAGVSDATNVGARWAVDHLLVDHRAVPTFVEVKRSSDTRIRREIVGQMLDYAANATTYWPVDRIRTLAAEQYGGVAALDEQVGALLAAHGESRGEVVEQFWHDVEENLRSSRVRLLFVADELPRELRRIVEFLNEQLPRVEVLGVELRKYEGAGVQALVPRVIGQTERTRAERFARPARKKQSPVAFLAGLPPEVRDLYESILRAAEAQGLIIEWGTRSFGVSASVSPGKRTTLLWAYEPGSVGREFGCLEFYDRDVADPEVRRTLRNALLAREQFERAGNYTIRLDLSPGNVAAAWQALPHLWDAFRALRPGDTAMSAGELP